MLIRKFFQPLLIFTLSAVLANAQVMPAPQELESGKPIEREIAGGETHTYQIKLAAGQFMRVLVEQKSIDIALALVGPDGKQLIDSDLANTLGARKPLSFEAKVSGDYRVVVRTNGAATLRGAYQVRLDLKDSIGEQDRKQMTAEPLLIEAAVLIRRKDFQAGIEKQQQALMLWREIGDQRWEGDTLRSVGHNYGSLSAMTKPSSITCRRWRFAAHSKIAGAKRAACLTSVSLTSALVDLTVPWTISSRLWQSTRN